MLVSDLFSETDFILKLNLLEQPTSADTAVKNFVTDVSSSYFAKLYQKHQLYGGHVIMLGLDNEDAAMTALQAFPGGFHIVHYY